MPSSPLDPEPEATPMLSWTIAFLIIALLAGVLGFTGIARTATGIAKVLFFIFLILFLLSFLRRMF